MRFDCDIDAFKFRRAMDEACGYRYWPAPGLLYVSPLCTGFSRPLSIRQLARVSPTALQVLRVHRLRERAKTLFPASPWNQEAWVQARLRMRSYCIRRPRVQIGSDRPITFARTLRAARFHGDPR